MPNTTHSQCRLQLHQSYQPAAIVIDISISDLFFLSSQCRIAPRLTNSAIPSRLNLPRFPFGPYTTSFGSACSTAIANKAPLQRQEIARSSFSSARHRVLLIEGGGAGWHGEKGFPFFSRQSQIERKGWKYRD